MWGFLFVLVVFGDFWFLPANALNLWLHGPSCASVDFEVHWGKSVFVSSVFLCLAKILQGRMQALTPHYQLPVHEASPEFNSESLKPIQKYVVTYYSVIPFSVFSCLSGEWMTSLKDIMKICLSNSIKHSVKIIILPKPICIWIKQTPSSFFFNMCRHRLKILKKTWFLNVLSPHSPLN